MSDDRRDSNTNNPWRYSDMSTDELGSLIGDLLLEDNMDTALVDKLLDAYDKREGMLDVDVDEAWERFKRDYSGQGEIYLTDDADNPPQTTSADNRRNRRRYKPLKRLGIAAAAFIILVTVFFNTTVLGGSIWRSITQWGRETFEFVDRVNPLHINDELMGLHGALKEHGITELLAPTWIPDGFVLTESSIISAASQVTFIYHFMDGSKNLVVQVISHDDPAGFLYERSGDDAASFKRNGIEHHIMANEDKIQVVWVNKNFECSISGDMTEGEAEKITNSIYER